VLERFGKSTVLLVALLVIGLVSSCAKPTPPATQQPDTGTSPVATPLAPPKKPSDVCELQAIQDKWIDWLEGLSWDEYKNIDNIRKWWFEWCPLPKVVESASVSKLIRDQYESHKFSLLLRVRSSDLTDIETMYLEAFKDDIIKQDRERGHLLILLKKDNHFVHVEIIPNSNPNLGTVWIEVYRKGWSFDSQGSDSPLRYNEIRILKTQYIDWWETLTDEEWGDLETIRGWWFDWFPLPEQWQIDGTREEWGVGYTFVRGEYERMRSGNSFTVKFKPKLEYLWDFNEFYADAFLDEDCYIEPQPRSCGCKGQYLELYYNGHFVFVSITRRHGYELRLDAASQPGEVCGEPVIWIHVRNRGEVPPYSRRP